jgi:hypothetical protein
MKDTTTSNALKTIQNFYVQKEYAKAIDWLENNQSQMDKAIWHFNLGLFNAKLENWSNARFHFLQAELMGYSGLEINQNLKIINDRLDLIQFEKALSTKDHVIKVGMELSHGVFIIFAIFMVLLSLILSLKKRDVKKVLFFLVLGFLFIGADLWIRSWDKRVVIESQEIVEGPSSIFSAKEELPPGLVVVVDSKDEWLKIIYPSRFSGWIKDRGLKELK